MNNLHSDNELDYLKYMKARFSKLLIQFTYVGDTEAAAKSCWYIDVMQRASAQVNGDYQCSKWYLCNKDFPRRKNTHTACTNLLLCLRHGDDEDDDDDKTWDQLSAVGRHAHLYALQH